MNLILKSRRNQVVHDVVVRNSHRDSHRESQRSYPLIVSVVAWIARGIVLASLLCTVWWFGGVDPAPKALVGIMLIVALTLTVVRSLTSPVSARKVPLLMLSLISGWLLWAWLQTCVLHPSTLSAISPGVAQTIGRFRDASSSLDRFASFSLVPELTTSVLAWQSIVGVAFLLSAQLFDSKASRLILLIVLTANTVLLSSWGIIQRSTGTSDLLPGIANPIDGSNPFGSFIYKNSGGAALLLGIAAIAGLMTHRIGLLLNSVHSRTRHSTSGAAIGHTGVSTNDAYDLSSRWLPRIFSRRKLDIAIGILTDPMVILISFGLALAFAGIASALSRGAWIGLATGGAVFVAGLLVTRRAIGSAIALVAVTIAAGMLLVVLFENNERVIVRVEMLDGEVFRKDDRWNHWPAAVQSLATYFPTGAGLGTYGYASLPFQENSYDGWYKQAHNQYLETAVESGVPGIILALTILSLLAVWVVRLLSQESPEAFAWGAITCIAGVGTAVQAVGDFVITTPANTLTIAILMGTAASLITLPSTQVLRRTAKNSAWETYAASPISWCVIAIPVAFLSQRVLMSELEVYNLLNATEVPTAIDSPTAESCRENIATLEKSSEVANCNSRIQLRLGHWNALLYRSITMQSMMSETQKPASDELWNATDLSIIFATLLAIPEVKRDEARTIYAGNASSQAALESTYKHIRNSIAGNPIMFQSHWKLAELAPLMGEPFLPDLESARKLAGVSSQQLFKVGLLANYANEVSIMNEAWRRSLEIDAGRLPTVTEMALSRESEERVMEELYPDRASLLMSVSRRSDLPLSIAARQTAMERAIASLNSNDNKEQLTAVERMQLRATIAEMQSKWSDASSIYANLIRVTPRDANIRFRFANVLLQLGDTKDAWTQTNTGARLSPGDPQSVRLFQNIERIKKGK